MAITVFVWDPHVDMYGHAAMHIEGGPYISWWPSSSVLEPGKNPMFGSYANVHTMRDDKAAERRPPSWASAPITCLDEEAIKVWWTKFAACPPGKESGGFKSTGTYNVLTTSCSGVVFRALAEGGLHKNAHATAIAANIGHIVSPEDIKDIAAALAGELGFWDTVKFLAVDQVVPGDLRDIIKYGRQMAQ